MGGGHNALAWPNNSGTEFPLLVSTGHWAMTAIREMLLIEGGRLNYDTINHPTTRQDEMALKAERMLEEHCLCLRSTWSRDVTVYKQWHVTRSWKSSLRKPGGGNCSRCSTLHGEATRWWQAGILSDDCPNACSKQHWKEGFIRSHSRRNLAAAPHWQFQATRLLRQLIFLPIPAVGIGFPSARQLTWKHWSMMFVLGSRWPARVLVAWRHAAKLGNVAYLSSWITDYESHVLRIPWTTKKSNYDLLREVGGRSLEAKKLPRISTSAMRKLGDCFGEGDIWSNSARHKTQTENPAITDQRHQTLDGLRCQRRRYKIWEGRLVMENGHKLPAYIFPSTLWWIKMNI